MAWLGLALAGCGGGGSGGSTGEGTQPLTVAQQAVQDAYLAANGGIHYPMLLLPSTGIPASSAPPFYAYDLAFAVPLPLSSTPQHVTVALDNYTSRLVLPDFSNGVPGRPLINGKIYLAATLPNTWDERLRLSGDHVISESMATDGVTVASSLRIVGHQSVSLSGLLADAPADVKKWPALAILSTNPDLLKSNAAFEPGAAYYRRQAVREGDAVFMADCTATTTTTGASPAPCGTATTVEAAFPHAYGPQTYNLSDGTIQTLQGLRAWVSNQPLSGVPTTQQLVLLEMGGHVLRGFIQRDGTPIRYTLTDGTIVDYWPRLNKLANDSLKAAFNFI